ncbi:MAG: response regulator transcription factor [Acidimicrobiales bacterium]
MVEGCNSYLERLSPRERQVLLALMHGKSAGEISRELYVSVPTVRSQIRSILVKLGVSSQLAAVVLAYRSGWGGEGYVDRGAEHGKLAVGA